MIRRPRATTLLFFLGFCACSYRLVRDGELNVPRASKIEAGLSALRELPFRRSVPIDLKSPDALRKYLVDELAREYSPEELRELGRVYERLGLLPVGTDLEKSFLRLYSTQIAGFYDPRVEKLFLVHPGMPSGGWVIDAMQFVLQRDLVGEMLLAHELTHALQDQHFDAIALAEDRDNDDRALAVASVIEGDATLSGFAYVFGGLPSGSAVDLVHRLQAIPDEIAVTLPDTPAVLRETLIFRYTGGAEFVSWGYLAGGWRAVDALLRNPPLSSEQILWPEKYFVTPDDPVDVSLGGLERYQTKDWKLLEENTLGELVVRILVRERLGEERGIAVAKGWDGDRYAAFAGGGEIEIVWLSAWDTERDALEFLHAERAILQSLFPGEVARDGERFQATGQHPWWIERRGDKVAAIIGLAPGEAALLAEKVWAESSFRPYPVTLDTDLAQAAANSSPRRTALPSRSSFKRWASTERSATGWRNEGTSR